MVSLPCILSSGARCGYGERSYLCVCILARWYLACGCRFVCCIPQTIYRCSIHLVLADLADVALPALYTASKRSVASKSMAFKSSCDVAAASFDGDDLSKREVH